jgi:signal transduction histidine kinase/CheY-like chemotaxis protein
VALQVEECGLSGDRSLVPDALAFIPRSGELGELIRGFDWARTELGEPAQWPDPLRRAVRLMLTSCHPMLVLWGARLRCFYNDAFRRYLGDEKHPAILGTPAREAWGEAWDEIGHQLESVMKGAGANWRENHRVPIYRNGRLEATYWTYSYTPIDHGSADSGVEGVLVVCTETTAQILEDQRLQELASSLREADLRKDEFIAVLAHELRNPLAPIRNAAALLDLPTHSGTPIWAKGVIDRQVGFMSQLLDDLLDVSRIGRGTLSLNAHPVRIAEVLDAAIEMAHPTITQRGHVLTVSTSLRDAVVVADSRRLAQALANLLNNAAKYTTTPADIFLNIREVADKVEFEVVDQGLGLEPRELQEVFDLFKQVKDHRRHSAGGLGVGLALVRGIAALHGGSVEAASAGRGKGSTFKMVLPLGLADAALRTVHPECNSALVLGQNRDSVSSVGDQLASAGFTVHLAHDEETARAIAEHIRPQLLLIDFHSGIRFDGFGMANSVGPRDFRQWMTVVGIASDVDEQLKKLALAAGFDALLPKPIDVAQIRKLRPAAPASREP